MTINLYIGDTNIELAKTALAADPRAFLIDHSNCVEFLNNPPVGATVYTSIGDLPKISKNNSVIYKLLDLADNIYYCPPDVWSDNKSLDFKNITNSLQGLTESILYDFKKQKNNVHNLDLSHYSSQLYTSLVDTRKTNCQQLWIAGCSISHGVGVESTQRYGQLIADSLNLPVSFLTSGGSSISWAVDQLTRSDIRANDIVILGLTEESRFPYWTTSGKVWHIQSNYQKQIKQLPFTNLSTNIIDRLITDENCFYQSAIRIYQLINFCNRLNINLLIFGLICSTTLSLYLHDLSNFINYKNFKSPNNLYDLGTDNKHPGPKQHQLYADFCQSALKKLSYI